MPKNYRIPGTKAETTSFVRESDINKAQTDLSQTLKEFEAGLNNIRTKYLNQERKTRLDMVKEQQKALEKLALDFLTKEAQIKKQTALEIQKIELNGIKLDEKQRAKLEEQNKKQQALRDKKELLALLEEQDKKSEIRLQKELDLINAKIALADPNSTKAEIREADRALYKDAISKAFGEGNDKYDALASALKKGFDAVSNEINDLIDKYADYQETINTRLQGSDKTFKSMESKLTQAVGVNPYFKTEDMLDDLQELVGLGINYNVEQRAFLETISDKIANTFDAADASLLRIVQLQQSDSTAARLGMEAHLTSYLNNMFEDSQYLSNAFDKVQSALVEASSQMSNQNAVAFEYQVQKWLGSLYSVGMSEGTVGSLAEALGYLGSGNVSALNGTAMQNLLAMASSRVGLSYADLLTGGLNESTTNALLYGLTSYLQEIAGGANNVVKSQFAETFGVSISDLTAALNLNTETLRQLTTETMSYSADISELNSQMGKVVSRTSTASMVNTTLDNAKFSLASSVASNPVLSAMWQITDLIQSVTGGINIPAFSVFGTGVDLNTTVENLMKLGIVGIGSLGMIGDVISGISSTFAPASMLSKMGISAAISSTKRGSGLNATQSGLTQSASIVFGNASGSDFATSTLNEANSSASSQLQEQVAAAAESGEKSTTDIYELVDTRLIRISDILTTGVSLLAKQNGAALYYASGAAYEANGFTAMLEDMETRVTVAAPTSDIAATTAEYLANIEEGVFDILAELRSINTKLEFMETRSGGGLPSMI